LAKEVNPKRG